MRDVGLIRRERGYGMKARLRPDGRWEARWPDADGKVRSVYSRLPGRAGERDVEAKRDKAIRARDAGLRPTGDTLDTYVGAWLTRNPKRLGAETIARYRGLHVRHLATPQGKIALTELRPEDLEDLYAERIAAGVSPKTVELLHGLVRGALATAAQRGHVAANEATKVRPPKVERPAREVFTPAEIERIVDAEDRLSALWTVLYQTTLREGEWLAARWSAVDLDAGLYTLRTPEKGARPRRIRLAARSLRALRWHKARQAEERLASGGAYEEEGYVFATLDGRRLNRHRVLEAWHRLLASLELPERRVHDLRHAGITHNLADGVPLKVVQEMAGHASAETTLDTYAHVTEDMQQQAIEAQNRRLA